ncbi:MAG: FkbM family methyltransferase [Sulfuricella sp.]
MKSRWAPRDKSVTFFLLCMERRFAIPDMIAKLHKLLSILAVNQWRWTFICLGVAAGVEHAAILRQLRDVRCVVDIGANRGQFALVARYCFPAARIVSFEPLLSPSNIYRSVFADDKNVTLYQVAIGPEAGNVTIHVSQRDDSSSLLPISSTQNLIFPGTAEVSAETISAGPLNLYFNHSVEDEESLLKLDVQGFELQALAGCEDRLRHFTWIYVECSFIELYEGQAFAHEVIAWLRERDFDLTGVYNVIYKYNGRAVQADFLFSKKKC